MPAAQALAWTIEGARDSFKWLKELQDQWEEARVKNKDGSSFRKKQRIIADAFAMYITSLFDTRSGTHSFIKSYQPHKFIKNFQKHTVVQKCIKHRHNRAGHQSKQYGFVVPLDEILSSDLDSWLSEAYYAVCTDKLTLIS